MRRQALAGCLLLAMGACGGETPVTPPTPTPTATPTPAPTPTPTPGMLDPTSPIYCVPTPAPLYGFRVKIHADYGDRKVLDSRALVGKDTAYCSTIGYPGDICVVRDENDPMAVTCNNAVTGKAKDTGRYGPTWYVASNAPGATGDFGWYCLGPTTERNGERCKNSADNQFLLNIYAEGYYTACGETGGCSTLFVKWP